MSPSGSVLRVTVAGFVGAVLGLGCRPGNCPPVERCTTWIATPGECVRSEIREVDQADPRLVRLVFTYAWTGAEPTRPDQVDWIVRRSRLAEARATARERIACERHRPAERNVAFGACRPVVMREASALFPPSPGREDRERICPQAGPQPLDPEIRGLEPAELEAVFRPAVAGWQRAAVAVSPHRAEGIYARGDRQVRIEVRDMIHACPGAAEATDTLLDTEHLLEPEARPRRVMSATSAVLVEWSYQRRRVVMWVGGRCRVAIDPVDHAVPADALVAAGHAVDIVRLEALCRGR